MELRPLVRQDWQQIARLAEASILAGSADHYSSSEVAAWVRSHGLESVLRAEHAVVVATGSRVVGVAGANSHSRYAIRFAFVDPSHWRRGIGTLLVGRLETFCASRGVSEISVAAAENATDFYKSLGFTAEGPMRLLMSAGKEDDLLVEVCAVAMRKTLPQSSPLARTTGSLNHASR